MMKSWRFPLAGMLLLGLVGEISKSGDLAYSQGVSTMTMSDPKTHQPFNDKGSYVTVYKKTADGSWKAVSDINTSEMPPPGSH